MARILKRTVLLLSLALLVAAGYYTYTIFKFSQDIQSKNNNTPWSQLGQDPSGTNTGPVESAPEPPRWEGKERVNILLIGADSRGVDAYDIPRSDSLILVSVDPVTKQTHLFSILRDTYVQLPGGREDRINTAFSLSGPKMAMKAVSDLMGVPVQYYVYTDFMGFIKLVDALGGIEYEVEKDMRYTDPTDDEIFHINLKKGLQHMDGQTALQYVRFRADARSDYARTERQRQFLQVVAEKLQTTSSILRLPRILTSIEPYIETNLSLTEMVKLGALGFDIRSNEIDSQQIPPFELLKEEMIDGKAVLTVNPSQLQKFVAGKLEETGATAPARNGAPRGSAAGAVEQR